MLRCVCRLGLVVLLLEPDPCKLLHQSWQSAATLSGLAAFDRRVHTWRRVQQAGQPLQPSNTQRRSILPLAIATRDARRNPHLPSLALTRPTPRMPSSRKSTPRRGRSSSVVSNVSTTSAKQEPTSNSTPRRSKAAAAAAKDEGEATPSTPKAAAAAAAARPALPSRGNPALPNFDVPVKLQVICRDGK